MRSFKNNSSRTLQKGNALSFEDSNESQYSSLDYLILKQLAKVMECANNLHNAVYKTAFINSVQALHQIAQFYWMYDDDYKEGIKLLTQWKKDQLKEWADGDNTVEIEVPMLFVEISAEKDDDGTEYTLKLETDRKEEVSLLDLDVIESKLFLHLLMTVITKRQKKRDIEDSY